LDKLNQNLLLIKVATFNTDQDDKALKLCFLLSGPYQMRVRYDFFCRGSYQQPSAC